MIHSKQTTERPFVLLTGATGLVGGHVLARLLSSGIGVAVLIRGQRRSSARDRFELLMQKLERQFGRLFERPVLLEGELCQPGLGLSSTERIWVANHCGSVIHSAASILFRPANSHPYGEPLRTNIEGTRSLLALMGEANIREWHYVSTAYVAGTRRGLVGEDDSLAGREFGNDYERSKAEAESILRQSSEIDSLTVYRPSIVLELDPQATPRGDQTISQTFGVYRALATEFGLPDQGMLLKSLGLQGQEGKNLVSAAWVARMIAEVWRHPELHGRTYHLTNRQTVSVTQLEASFHEAGRMLGILPDNASAVEKTAQARSRVESIDSLAAPFVAAFGPYFREDPQFGRANTEDALRRLKINDEPIPDATTLSRFCVSSAKSTSTELIRPHAGPAALPGFIPSGEWDPEHLAATHRGDPEECGLQLVGSGGGSWILRGDGAYPSSPDSASRLNACWVMTVPVWNSLCRQPQSLEDLIRQGHVLVEHAVSTVTPKASVNLLQRFLSSLHLKAGAGALLEEAGNVQ
jgi:thioester reductase-like protein